MLSELKKELKLRSDDDENTFEESLGGRPYQSGAVYFNFRKDQAESVAASAENWQILSPVRRGMAGVDRLNRMIQARFRKRALSWATPEVYWQREDHEAHGSARHSVRRQSDEREE